MSRSFKWKEEDKSATMSKGSVGLPGSKPGPDGKTGKPESATWNPFIDEPAVKVEEDGKGEEDAEFMEFFEKNTVVKRTEKRQIVASPNFILAKKGLNKKASLESKSTLNKFGPDKSPHDDKIPEAKGASAFAKHLPDDDAL